LHKDVIHKTVIRFLVFIGVLAATPALAPAPARAAPCQGRDLIAMLGAGERAALESRVSAYPFARGIYWRAQKGKTRITIFGTYHVPDRATARFMRRIRPAILKADVVFLEAVRSDFAKLKKKIADRPQLLELRPGQPSLPEALSQQEWARLAAAMERNGIEPFVGARMAPWAISGVLDTSPCIRKSVRQAGVRGLDWTIMETAEKRGIPTRDLEPYDTIFRIFNGLGFRDQLAMLRIELVNARFARDSFTTLRKQYLTQNIRQIWELSRLQAYRAGTQSRARIDGMFAKYEEVMLSRRNRAWVRRLLRQARGKNVFVAVGALHLSGRQGVLNLLAGQGYIVTRLKL